MIKIKKSNSINNYGTKIAFVYWTKEHKYHRLGNKPARMGRIGSSNPFEYKEFWINGKFKGNEEFGEVA